MSTGFCRTQHFLSEHPKVTNCIPQLIFSFYRHRPIHADFSGGQISSDAGLLPLRAFDQRYGLTRDVAERMSDPREDERVRHSVLSLSGGGQTNLSYFAFAPTVSTTSTASTLPSTVALSVAFGSQTSGPIRMQFALF